MFYPKFLEKNDVIGICAPSAGVGKKIDDFNTSISILQKDYQIIESEHVRVHDERGGSAQERGNEINALFSNNEIDFVMCAAGGDFLIEMLPYISFETLKNHPKWLMGFSDPTSILYAYTTLYDVATIYGANAGSYDITPLPEHLQNNLEIIRGNLIPQHSFKRYQKAKPWEVEGFQPDSDVDTKCTHGDIHVKGRCIGGCIDALKDLIGTKFDGTKDFISRYKQDGFVWYFDNFSLSAECLYRTLLQMQYAGWFDYTKAIIIGRTLIESSETGMSYNDIYSHSFLNIPIIYQADIGHTMPSFTMINGAMIDLQYKEKQVHIQFSLE